MEGLAYLLMLAIGLGGGFYLGKKHEAKKHRPPGRPGSGTRPGGRPGDTQIP